MGPGQGSPGWLRGMLKAGWIFEKLHFWYFQALSHWGAGSRLVEIAKKYTLGIFKHGRRDNDKIKKLFIKLGAQKSCCAKNLMSLNATQQSNNNNQILIKAKCALKKSLEKSWNSIFEKNHLILWVIILHVKFLWDLMTWSSNFS